MRIQHTIHERTNKHTYQNRSKYECEEMPNRDGDGEVEVDTISGRKRNDEDRRGREGLTRTPRGEKWRAEEVTHTHTHLGAELEAKRGEARRGETRRVTNRTTARSKGTANNKLTAIDKTIKK